MKNNKTTKSCKVEYIIANTQSTYQFKYLCLASSGMYNLQFTTFDSNLHFTNIYSSVEGANASLQLLKTIKLLSCWLDDKEITEDKKLISSIIDSLMICEYKINTNTTITVKPLSANDIKKYEVRQKLIKECMANFEKVKLNFADINTENLNTLNQMYKSII